MPLVASDIMDRSRAILNDIPADIYTNTALLPFLKIANDEFESELINAGQSVQKVIDTNIDVDEDEVTLDLPSDLISPIKLFERARTDTEEDQFEPMRQVAWVPVKDMAEKLGVWDWRDQSVNFVGATTDRTVLLRYIRTLSPITGNNSPVELDTSNNYLAYKTAAEAVSSLAKDYERELKFNSKAAYHLNKLLNIGTRSLQSANRVRRAPFRLRLRRFL